MSPRTVAVAEAFGLGIDEEKEFQIYDNVELKIGRYCCCRLSFTSFVAENRKKYGLLGFQTRLGVIH